MNELFQQIFEVCIIPLLGIITAYIVKLINKKAAEIDAQIDNEAVTKYTNMLADIIAECVSATNQTYVDTLKNQGKFDSEAQAEAFNKTYKKIMDILSEDAKRVLTVVYGDLYMLIATSIEAEVKKAKVI